MIPMAMSDLPIELEAETGVQPVPDRRPRMDEPLPVRLVAIADVTLPVIAGLEVDLDRFYVALLEFVRDDDRRQLIYHADNFALRFVVRELLPERGEYRPVQIEVQNLLEAEHKLMEAKIEYVRQRTLVPGEESLVLLDPAGNWVELVEYRAVM
jgi:hypothetical protein